MSWISKLYETYGQALERYGDDPQQMIMPIYHTPQNAHINIVLHGEGNFLRAQVLEKTQIVLPATEKSEARANAIAPHGLQDKLQYVAADYKHFGGPKKPGYDNFVEQLGAWIEFDSTIPHLSAVYSYVQKGCVIEDLVEHGVLFEQDGELLGRWDADGDAPLIFKVLPKNAGETDQGAALVCWTVEIPGTSESKTWQMPAIQESWIRFVNSQGTEKGLCFVKGQEETIAGTHPAKIRHSGDKAKLISSNDGDGFTFRGRFITSAEAAGVSQEVTQKAHNALGWLVGRQGYRTGDQTFVAWAVSLKEVPNPLDDDLFSADESGTEESDHGQDLGAQIGLKVKQYLQGYGSNDGLERNESVCIMGIDSATPGRMGIIYYRETIAEEFLANLEQWQVDLAWPQRKKIPLESDTGKKALEKTVWKTMAPSPYRTIDAVYGTVVKSTDSLKKSLMARLIPCIVEGQPIPIDIVQNAVRRATNRSGYSNDEWWLWEQNLGIACALYKGYRKRTRNKSNQKEYTMGLDEQSKSRDYLYGRLLAIAERIESYALYKAGEKRITTAERMMQRFADRPFSTWRNLELSLQPYMHRLQTSAGGFLKVHKDLLDSVHGLFDPEDFGSDKSLSGEFLLGFHSQRLELNKKRETSPEAAENEGA